MLVHKANVTHSIQKVVETNLYLVDHLVLIENLFIKRIRQRDTQMGQVVYFMN